MAYFNFARLIEKYNCNFTAVISSEGHYDDSGEWVKGETTEKQMTGAIIGFKESKVFRSEGTLTAKDKRLFTRAISTTLKRKPKMQTLQAFMRMF